MGSMNMSVDPVPANNLVGDVLLQDLTTTPSGPLGLLLLLLLLLLRLPPDHTRFTFSGFNTFVTPSLLLFPITF